MGGRAAQHVLLVLLLVDEGAIVQVVQIRGDVERAERVEDGPLPLADGRLTHGGDALRVYSRVEVLGGALHQVAQVLRKGTLQARRSRWDRAAD